MDAFAHVQGQRGSGGDEWGSEWGRNTDRDQSMHLD
jgi:hypothetical protein